MPTANGEDGGQDVGRTVMFVTNVPTPYRIPLFNELARQLRELELRLKVVFSAAGYPRRQWEIDWELAEFDSDILDGRPRKIDAHESYVFRYPGLIRKVRRERPVAVIIAGFPVSALLLALACPLFGIPCIIWSGELRRRSGSLASLVRDLQRRFIVRRADALVAYGSRAARHLRELGASEAKISVALNTVEVEYFTGSRTSSGNASLSGMRVRNLLAVTTLVPRKQPETLIRLAAELSARRTDFRIQIIGDGPAREHLERLATELGVSRHVEFSGYLQRDEIARMQQDAYCFLFPTTYDIWGLVLVEAMAAGLPCLASVHAGATEDLIEHGETGYAVDFSGTENVARIVENLLDNPDAARCMGLAGQSFVREHASLTISAGGFVQAIETALDRGA